MRLIAHCLGMIRHGFPVLLVMLFSLIYHTGAAGLGGNCSSINGCHGPHVYCSLNSSVCECQERFNASDGLCKAALGSSCELTVCQDRYAMCNEDYICKCKYGYVQADGICKAIRGFDCEETECYAELMSCVSESGTCDCKEGYRYSLQRCYRVLAIGENCTEDCGNMHSRCSSLYHRCECLNGYIEKNRYCHAMLGSDCSYTDCFHGNALCGFYKSLSTSVCVCPAGFIPSGNYCLPGIGAECRTVGQCADEHAYCDSDSICKCESGYTESSGVCSKDLDTCSPDDCYHPGLRCSNINCTCGPGYVQDNNICKADFGQQCGSGICFDIYASCSNDLGTCQCSVFFIYDLQTRTCKPDIGADCSERDCFSENSFCNSNKICECMPGYTQQKYSKQCLPGVGKNCSSIGSCISWAGCISGVCQCLEGYGEINGYCYPRLGFHCDGPDSTCYGDHVSCNLWYNNYFKSFYCSCDAGYRQIGHTCLADLGTNCSRVPCATKSMRCSNNSLCICQQGFAEIDGTCRTESEISCSSGECIDDSSNCNLESNCSCPNGYKLVDNKCKTELYGYCHGNTTECADKYAECRRHNKFLRCQCKTGYFGFNGSCTRGIGSHCSADEDCYYPYNDCSKLFCTWAIDRSAACIKNICTCKPGYVESGSNVQNAFSHQRQCLPDIGSNCTNETSCYQFPLVVCSAYGICECLNDPTPSTNKCERGVGGLCLKVTLDDNGTCYDPNASCRNVSYSWHEAYRGTYFATAMTFTNVCICNDGFKQSGAICKADLGSSCTRAACYDRNAACINNVCVCKTGYIAINGICRDEYLPQPSTTPRISMSATNEKTTFLTPSPKPACDAYHYGMDCIHECRCESNQQCDSVSGCVCNNGWEGDNCNVDIDECKQSLGPCSGTNTECKNTPGHYQCVCRMGYIRSNHTGECQACTGNTHGKECSKKCICSTENVQVSSQACHHVDGSCLCKPQWTGSKCREDVNECQDGKACDHKQNSECFNIPGGYTCQCKTGFTEKNGKCENGSTRKSEGTRLRFDRQLGLSFLVISVLLFFVLILIYKRNKTIKAAFGVKKI